MVAQLARDHDLKLPLAFVESEVEYVMGRFPSDKMETYLDAERTGRGIAPRIERANRARLLDVIAAYRRAIAAEGKLDWEDLPARVSLAFQT
jgi:hypothetical protein